MANYMYDKGRENFLGGDVDWDANNFKIALIDEADDTPSQASDSFWSDRASAARVAISGNLASKTKTAGVADAADVTFTAVTGDPSESIDLYQDTGTESTSTMIININTATGLPVTPNGGDISVVFDSGANKIFTL